MTAVEVALVVGCSVYVGCPSRAMAESRMAPASNRPGDWPASRRPPNRWLIGVGLTLAAAVVAATAGPRPVVLLTAGSAGFAAARRLLSSSRQHRQRRLRQRRAITLCDALSAELRAGLPMATAVRRCCRLEPELAGVVSAAELGGDVAHALRSCAQLPGAEGFRAVAAAWDVGGSSGSALAGVLDKMARGLRDDDDGRAEVEAALAPPRATARMLAALPLFGLALGASIGAHPLDFLVGTSWGLVCLSGGAVLALLGVWWVERIATAAEV